MLQVRVDVKEWLVWAQSAGIAHDILAFITFMPEALMRPVPTEPVPFSTPRAWASLSTALQLVEKAGVAGTQQRRALAFGRVSAVDAAIFCAMAEASLGELRPPLDYVRDIELLPHDDTARWFILSAIRRLVATESDLPVDAETLNDFLLALPPDHRFALFVGLVDRWGALGASPSLLASLKEATGL
jgi:hypothetical protein